MESLSSTTDEDRIRRILKGRMDASFVTAYELLKDEKDRKQAEVVKSSREIDEARVIVEEVVNRLEKGEAIDVNDHYVYGRGYSKAPRIVIDRVIEAFKEMKIDFSIKSNNVAI